MNFNFASLVAKVASQAQNSSAVLLMADGKPYNAVWARAEKSTRFAFFSCITEPSDVKLTSKGEIFPSGTDVVVFLVWGANPQEAENKIRRGLVETKIGEFETLDGQVVTVFADNDTNPETTLKGIKAVYGIR